MSSSKLNMHQYVNILSCMGKPNCTHSHWMTYFRKNSTIWVAGDLNLPNINWTDNTITGTIYSVTIPQSAHMS